jgi:hypothetical protein
VLARRTRRPWLLREDRPDKVFCGPRRLCISRRPHKRIARPVENTSSGPALTLPLRGGNAMHPEDLLKPDRLSEIILWVSGEVVLVSLLLVVAAALTRN